MNQGHALKAIIKQYGFTQQTFSEKLGISRTYLNDLFEMEVLPEKWVTIVNNSLQINFIESLQKASSVNEQQAAYEKQAGNIIYVPLYAYGGFLQGYASKIFIDSLERFSLPGITGEHFAFEVDGMSMYDMAAPGDFAIAKPEEKLEWMVKGKPYVLQTIDGLLIKLFDKIKEERAHFHSFNKEYNAIEIPLKSIKKAYFVTRILKKI